MKTILLSFEVTGCTNDCKHCYCLDIKKDRVLMSSDEVIQLSERFRELIDCEVHVLLLQEQTMYPEFISMIRKLKACGLQSLDRGLLVSNGFGLAHNKNLLEQSSEFYSSIKMTLFGTEKYHDEFVKRQGHFNEIISVSKRASALGMKVIWQMMLTRNNKQEISKLIELSKEMSVDYFVTAEYYQSGPNKDLSCIIPTEETIKNINFELYELTHGTYMPEYGYLNTTVNLENKINKVSLESLYIDSVYDVYPINCIDGKYKLGNLKTDMMNIVDQLKHPKKLPESIKERLSANLTDLIESYGSSDSNQMHTPQSLFEKLIYKQGQER